jgi:hypothetical protein
MTIDSREHMQAANTRPIAGVPGCESMRGSGKAGTRGWVLLQLFDSLLESLDNFLVFLLGKLGTQESQVLRAFRLRG